MRSKNNEMKLLKVCSRHFLLKIGCIYFCFKKDSREVTFKSWHKKMKLIVHRINWSVSYINLYIRIYDIDRTRKSCETQNFLFFWLSYSFFFKYKFSNKVQYWVHLKKVFGIIKNLFDLYILKWIYGAINSLDHGLNHRTIIHLMLRFLVTLFFPTISYFFHFLNNVLPFTDNLDRFCIDKWINNQRTFSRILMSIWIYSKVSKMKKVL